MSVKKVKSRGYLLYLTLLLFLIIFLLFSTLLPIFVPAMQISHDKTERKHKQNSDYT